MDNLTCVDCSCQQLPLDEALCDNLHEMNNSKVKGASLVLKDIRLCDYPKVFPKALYSIWCVLKNIIMAICWLLKRMKALEDKVNEIIDQLNAICQALKCLIAHTKKQAEQELKEALGNIGFSMSAQTSTEDASSTFMQSSTTNDGGFTFTFNSNDGVSDFAHGTIKGRVNHSYTPNDDGSIRANIQSVTLSSVDYVVTGTNTAVDKNISLTILGPNGQQLFYRAYDGMSSWSERPNKTVQLNITKDLPPGSNSGAIKALDIHDDWIFDTRGSAYAKYTNNNKKPTRKVPECDVECKSIAKL